MSKENEFINAIQKILTDFENSEQNLSTKNAKDILFIKELLDDSLAFIELHALVSDYVVNKMSRKLFGFLPFVIDLKTQLIHSLETPKFNPIKWLHHTRSVNRRHSTGNISEEHGSQLPEINASTHATCEIRFAAFDKKINDIKDSNNLLKTQNDELQKAVTAIGNDYTKIKADLQKVEGLLRAAQTEIQHLNLIILQKDEVLSKLTLENSILKQSHTSSTTDYVTHKRFS